MPSACFWGDFERLQEVTRSPGPRAMLTASPCHVSEGEALLQETTFSSGSDPGALVHVTECGESEWLFPQAQSPSVLTVSQPLGPLPGCLASSWLFGQFQELTSLKRESYKRVVTVSGIDPSESTTVSPSPKPKPS